jgi:hypothetical protein
MKDPKDSSTFDAFPVPKRRGRPPTATPDKKREDARLRQAALRERRNITLASIHFARDQLQACSTFSKSHQLEIWEAFIFYLNGIGESVPISYCFDGGQNTNTDFEGLRQAIWQKTPIDEINYI